MTVKVGYGDFPPIFTETSHGVSGLWVDLISLLNSIQNEYNFTLEPTTPKRRMSILNKNEVDIMANESPGFGWDLNKTEFSQPIYEITDRYVALQSTAKDQSYFSNFQGKRIRCILGFHYNFEKKYTDSRKPLLVERTTNSYGNLQALLDKRAEITVISDIYLPVFYQNNPTAKSKLLISNSEDGYYKMSFALSKTNPKITLKKINSYLQRLEKTGTLQRLRDLYGLRRSRR